MDGHDEYGDELSWDEIQALDAGKLVHVMLCNFNPNYKNTEYYMQNESYMAAAEELDRRLKGNQ